MRQMHNALDAAQWLRTQVTGELRTDSRKVQAGFEPLVEGFVRAPLNDIAAVEEVARTRPNVVAVLLMSARTWA